jgi:hypothetical protein
MEEKFIIMRKDSAGIITNEVATVTVKDNSQYMGSIFVNQDGKVTIVVSCGFLFNDMTDEMFNNIYDCYDSEVFGEIASVKEIEESFEPEWEISFVAELPELEEKLNKILDIHKREVDSVFEILSC